MAFFLCGSTCVFSQDLTPALEAITNTTKPSQLPPLDQKGRFKAYLKSLVSGNAIVSNFLIAGFEEGRNFPHEWNRTWLGYEKRVASQYGQFILDNTIELGIASIHREDNRYVRLGTGGFWRRFGNVARSMVVVSDTQGRHTVALGQIAGAYGSWAIASQVWEPRSEQSLGSVMVWGSVNVAAKGGANLIREFRPDWHKKRSTPGHP